VTVPAAGPTPTRAPTGSGEINLFRQGTGRPVVVLHAAGGAGAWNPYLEQLSQHFDVIAPDHPGMGLSDELAEVADMDLLVQHYVALFDTLGLDRFDLVGASFGGWIAAEVASTVPERIDRLVLMAPGGLDVPGAPVADLPAMTPQQLFPALFHDQAIAAAILSMPPTPEAAAQGARDMAGFVRIAGAGPVFLHNPELPARLSAITGPAPVHRKPARPWSASRPSASAGRTCTCCTATSARPTRACCPASRDTSSPPSSRSPTRPATARRRAPGSRCGRCSPAGSAGRAARGG
jgi:pimeloyl-ACP methyl ester carboxylesterase